MPNHNETPDRIGDRWLSVDEIATYMGQYDFGLWGGLYEPIVRLIKHADHDVELGGIYEALEADRPNV